MIRSFVCCEDVVLGEMLDEWYRDEAKRQEENRQLAERTTTALRRFPVQAAGRRWERR